MFSIACIYLNLIPIRSESERNSNYKLDLILLYDIIKKKSALEESNLTVFPQFHNFSFDFCAFNPPFEAGVQCEKYILNFSQTLIISVKVGLYEACQFVVKWTHGQIHMCPKSAVTCRVLVKSIGRDCGEPGREVATLGCRKLRLSGCCTHIYINVYAPLGQVFRGFEGHEGGRVDWCLQGQLGTSPHLLYIMSARTHTATSVNPSMLPPTPRLKKTQPAIHLHEKGEKKMR